MAINIILYSFSKRENSTKQPTAAGTTYTCTMLDETSLMNPTFKLSIATNPIGNNYCYVADFNRYYFIKDISTYQNFWYISCECDVLASFKTEIGLGSHYVLRSASDYDGDIIDNVYPAKMTATETREVIMTGYTDPFLRSGGYSYVVGIVGEASSSVKQFGSLTYYMMDEAALQTFCHFLMDNVDNWSGIAITEYSQGVQQALINPMQYIKSCMLVPVGIPSGATSPASIKFGYYSYTVGSGANIYEITNTNPVYSETCKIEVPKHPQAATRGNYLNSNPFSTYTLHVGPFGDIPVDPMVLQENTKIDLSVSFDLISGECMLVAYGDDHTMDTFYNGTAQIGVPINLSQVYVDGLAQMQTTSNSVFSMMGAVTGALGGGNPLTGLVQVGSALTSGIQDATRLNYPTVSGTPAGGSMFPFYEVTHNVYLLCKFLELVDENLAEIGRPLYKTKTINTLTGFILCQMADAQITGTQEEAQKINNYMNTGFFYE